MTQEAIVEAKLHKPDLILLDVMMPHMDGKEARKRLLADRRPRTSPSSTSPRSATSISSVRRLPDGATDYIVKPFSPSELPAGSPTLSDPKKREAMKKERSQKRRSSARSPTSCIATGGRRRRRGWGRTEGRPMRTPLLVALLVVAPTR